jgi:cellulose synthase/poly-beta-1,6-N-acetylglucosamine synthase-like glycosyltransferase
LLAPAIFLLAAAAILWVLAGYPLWLAWRARKSRPVRGGPCEPTVTILLPVYNGGAWLQQKLDCILQLDYPREQIQVIVISDGSTDDTAEIAGRYAGRGVEFLALPHGGKASAINAGIHAARGEVLFFTDVRQPLEPESLRWLTQCLADPEVGAVSGELIIRDGKNLQQASVGLYWKYEKWIRKGLSRVDSVLGATGAIYAMRRSLARPLPPETLLDDVYLPLLAFFAGYRVVFEERAIAYDSPTSLNAEFGRKVRTQAGVYQLLSFFPELLTRANRRRIDFVSHKLGRLLLPFAFIVLAISSAGLPGNCAKIALALQGGFYGLALLDFILPERFPLKRLTAPVRTFVTLLAAALWAASILFRPSRQFWKQATGSSSS